MPERRPPPPSPRPPAGAAGAPVRRSERWALALGGGTARGAAHIGVLKVLEARGTPPTALAGTSYGAIVAALYALGAPALEIERLVRQQNVMELWAQGVDFGLHRASLVHGRRLTRWLDRKFFMGASFDDAQLPLALAATDLASGRLQLLREGSIAAAVGASCALPGVFAPVPRGHRHLVDGGFVEPVPFRALQALVAEGAAGSRMLGVHAGLDVRGAQAVDRLRRLSRSRAGRAWHAFGARRRLRNPWSRLLRGLSIALRAYDHPLEPPPAAELLVVAPPIAWWDFHRAPEAIAAGEAAAHRWLAREPALSDRDRGRAPR